MPAVSLQAPPSWLLFLTLSLGLHALLLARMPGLRQGGPLPARPPLQLRLLHEAAPIPEPPPKPLPAKPAGAQPKPAPARSAPPTAPAATPAARALTSTGATARPGLVLDSLETASRLGARLERPGYAPCKSGSEMTARCAQPASYAQSVRHELEYDGTLPNYVAAADAAYQNKVKACTQGGLLSLGCMASLPSLVNRAAHNLKRRRD